MKKIVIIPFLVSVFFIYFLPNYQSYYTGHLYDIIISFIYAHWGFLGISLVGSIIFTLAALIFIELINKKELGFIAYFIFFTLSYYIFGLGFRPQIITYLFLFILLWLLESKNKILFYYIPILFLFWVNLHIGFFVGLFVLNFFLFSKNSCIDWFQKLIIIFSSFLTTLINPFGINVYRE